MRRALCIVALVVSVSGCSVHYHYDTIKNCPDLLVEDTRKLLDTVKTNMERVCPQNQLPSSPQP